jgi:hypothetical protein
MVQLSNSHEETKEASQGIMAMEEERKSWTEAGIAEGSVPKVLGSRSRKSWEVGPESWLRFLILAHLVIQHQHDSLSFNLHLSRLKHV